MYNILVSKSFLTLCTVIVVFIGVKITRKLIKSFVTKSSINLNRAKLTEKTAVISCLSLGFVVIMAILGVPYKELVVLCSSILAVLGVAFFAQWSILSNLTASIILLFHHPLRIGDEIKILDKEIDIQGKVTDITGFYTHIHIHLDSRDIIMPNNILIFKTIEILKNNS